jgi:uncharacterized protein (TIGR02145 family)
MKYKNKTWIYPLMIMGFGLILIASCNKNEESSKATLLPSTKNIVFNNNLSFGTLTDVDGNVYKTIVIAKNTIHEQTWMAENLKVTHYRNGDPIPNITEATSWQNITTAAYCDYNNTSAYSSIYGRLYNLYAIVDSRLICPLGWHIPSDTEWTVLTTNMGGQAVAGQNMKEIGLDHWQAPLDTAVKDTSGFTALPGGFRNGHDGSFNLPGYYGYWWSSTKNSSCDYFYRSVGSSTKEVYRIGGFTGNGFSVRCIKDSI